MAATLVFPRAKGPFQSNSSSVSTTTQRRGLSNPLDATGIPLNGAGIDLTIAKSVASKE
jgi:hypothetical protein